MQGDLPALFRRRVQEVLAQHRELVHTWEEADRRLTLTFPKQLRDGFDIMIEATDDGIIVFTEGAHVHFDRTGDDRELVEEALGLVRDLLSADMRVRELRAGGRPYRWFIESYTGERWEPEHEMGLLFWNYFGRRSEYIYRNHTLPGRLSCA